MCSVEKLWKTCGEAVENYILYWIQDIAISIIRALAAILSAAALFWIYLSLAIKKPATRRAGPAGKGMKSLPDI